MTINATHNHICFLWNLKNLKVIYYFFYYVFVELKGIGFNALNTIFWVVSRYILVKKENQTKEK